MKTLTLITGFVLFIYINTSAQNSLVKSDADLYWDTMPKRGLVLGGPQRLILEEGKIVDLELHGDKQGLLKHRKESIIRKHIYDEMFSRLLRDWGIEFWRRFPNDLRRFNWLSLTSLSEPAYFANLREGANSKLEGKFLIALDTIARNEWTHLCRRYFNEASQSTQIDSKEKERLLLRQFGDLNLLRWRNSEKDKFNINEYVKKWAEFAREYKTEKKDWQRLRQILTYKSDLGLDNADIKYYIGLLKSTKIEGFQKEAIYLEKIARLEEVPMNLNAKSIDGEEIDLRKLRGKLVLVDFWEITCSNCILKMPEIKSVYQQYKDKGFEVVSVCLFYNGKRQKDELKRITDLHHKIGSTWPLVLLGGNEGEAGRKIFNEYRFYEVPQLLLLDEEGKLLHYNGDLRNNGGVERLVKEHFKIKATNTQKTK